MRNAAKSKMLSGMLHESLLSSLESDKRGQSSPPGRFQKARSQFVLPDDDKLLSMDIGRTIIEKKLEQLRQQLHSNQIFLNMVIHDMRNPSSAIEFSIKEMFNCLQKHYNDIKEVRSKLM